MRFSQHTSGMTVCAILMMCGVANASFEDLDLTIEVDQAVAMQHIPRVVTLALHNPTQKVITGNASLSNQGWVEIYLTQPEGKEKEAHTDRSDAPSGGHGALPKEIAPRFKTSHRVLLRGGDQIVDPGEYRIRAEFEDWDGGSTIKSEPITFKVTPLPKEETGAAAFITKHEVVEVLSFVAGAINPSRVEAMKKFVAKEDFQQSIFMPYVKARLGHRLTQRIGAGPMPSKEQRARGVELMTEAINTDGYTEAEYAHFYLAEYYEDWDQHDQARRMFREFLEKWPESHFAPEARHYLKKLEQKS